MDLPIFSGMPESFPKFLTLFEARLNIQSATKCYKFNLIEKATAKQHDAFDKYLDKFKVESLKSCLGDHLEDVVSSISENRWKNLTILNKLLRIISSVKGT